LAIAFSVTGSMALSSALALVANFLPNNFFAIFLEKSFLNA
jgi:uncharacterized membrane protein